MQANVTNGLLYKRTDCDFARTIKETKDVLERVNMDISKVNTGKPSSKLTYILPRDMDQIMTVRDIVMYPKFRDYTLPEYQIFQNIWLGMMHS